MKKHLKGFRFALLDFHSARSDVGLKIAMFGIALIPLIYGALYLMAFYDPYGRLDTLPVAVVNEDKPAYTSSGQKVSAGDDLVKKLADTDALEWHFIDSDTEAQTGLERGIYYDKVVIPADFSKRIASADSDAPEQAHLVMVANEANNYLSSILGASVMRQVTANANYSIADNYLTQIFDSVGQTGESLKKAADGAGELERGLTDAEDGSKAITDNLASAAAGGNSLLEGLTSARGGSTEITENLATAAHGAAALSGGAVSAQDGSATITENLASAADGAAVLNRGLANLAEGLASGKSNSATLAAGLHQLQTQGSAKMLAGCDALLAQLDGQAEQLSKLERGSSAVADGVAQVAKLVSPALRQSLQTISDAVDSYKNELSDITTGFSTLSEPTTGVMAQIDAEKITVDGLYDEIKGFKGDIDTRYHSITETFGTLQPRLDTLAQGVDAIATSAQGIGADASKAKAVLDGAAPPTDEENTTGYTLTPDQYAALASYLDEIANAATGSSGIQRSAAAISGGVTDAGQVLGDVATSKEAMDADMGSIGVKMEAIDASMAAINGIFESAKQQVESSVYATNSLISDSQATIANAQTLANQVATAVGAQEIDQLKQAADAVAAGTSTLKTTLSTDRYSTAEEPQTLHAAVKKLSVSAEAFNRTMLLAALGADELTAQGWQRAAEGATSAQQGAGSLSTGLMQLRSGSVTLTDGLTSVQSGAADLASGLNKLRDGSATLTAGLSTAQSGSTVLTDGINKLHDGSATLTEGLDGARVGTATLADGLAEGVEKVVDATRGASSKAAMMSEPVIFDEQPYTYVANYGSGFAPYFISLGLWVGALVMTFLLRPFNMRLVTSGANPLVTAGAGLVPWLIVGSVQAVLLAATIQFACGISVAHPLAYYLLTVLASWVFCAAIQAITAAFGFPGKFVAVVLLMLQLTTAAGTFPIQTEFTIFQALSPWLPMTYVVHALRMAMAGTAADLSLVLGDLAALGVFMLGFFVLTAFVAWRKRLVTLMDLHPLVDL